MSRSLVVDASVALKWLVVEDDSGRAEDLLASDTTFHAPTVMRVELANALWKNVRKGAIEGEQAHEGLLRIGRMVARWHDMEPILPDALSLSIAHDHPIYDFCYVVLARSLGLSLVTADDRLIRKIKGTIFAEHLRPLSDVS